MAQVVQELKDVLKWINRLVVSTVVLTILVVYLSLDYVLSDLTSDSLQIFLGSLFLGKNTVYEVFACFGHTSGDTGAPVWSCAICGSVIGGGADAATCSGVSWPGTNGTGISSGAIPTASIGFCL